MKYLFIITGIAYGHLTREEAIINKLEKLDKKSEIVIATYGTAKKHFEKNYKILELNPMYFPDKFNKVQFFNTLFKNYKLFLHWVINGRLINEYINENKPKVVISDWEPFAIFIKKCEYLIWNYKPKYAKIKNIESLIEKISIEFSYFVSWVLGKKIILPTLNKEKNAKNYIYTGLIIRKNPNEVKGLDKYKDSILVMIGGANFGLDLARKINNISGSLNEAFVIFGYKCKSRNCIGYEEFKDDYLSYLKSCKAVISLGGYSGISESIFYKKPNLAFPIKNWIEQQAVVEEFKDYIEIGDIESNEEELKVEIKEFLGNINRIKKKLNTLKLKNGADEIAEILCREGKS
jgi:uncharacterized protein (TIGR00661 family)